MKEQLKLFEIDLKYVRDLSKVDDNVMSVSPQINKSGRSFVGVLVLVNGKKYCVPLSSPKKKFESKKNSIDFMRIIDESKKDSNGMGKIIGALNFNNMLPVCESVITHINIQISKKDSPQTANFKKLLTHQLDWCQKNEDKLLSHANKTYVAVTQYADKNRNLTRRCCDFKKLEEVLAKRLEKEGVHNPSEQTSFKEKVTSMSDWSDNVQNAAAERDEQNKSKKER